MKYTIEIDDVDSTGKGLLTIARELSKKSKGIRIIDEGREDKLFLDKMIKARKKGILSASEKEEFINQLRQLTS